MAELSKRLVLTGVLALTIPVVAADFPTPFNTENDTKAAPPAAADAVKMIHLPPGFKATVFASEPDVQNPIAMTWDSKGRLWIAENYTYGDAKSKFYLGLRDRVLIFEDKNKDGHFSSRKVFTDELQMLTSVEVGQGGVWLMCPPQLLFVPDKNGDGVPDGAPQVVLDGFTVPTENYHNFANGLHWGPDGWLYGRCGASAPGEVGAPGTPADKRIPLRGTLWRYHPQRKVFETLSCGTTNPWGHDWDAFGEAFFVNTVNGHLWHMIPGAHFVASHSVDANPRAYSLIDMHADHWHFDNAQDWTKSRDGAANAFGGGHAHSGTMIYLGDNWPDQYRGNLFTLNFHGRRANQEILERKGSGYVAHHGKDFFLTDDTWFRGLDLGYGPDGGVFVLDWSDTGECHERTGVHRTSGRIYKITYGDPKQPTIGDLAQASPEELVKLLEHPNEWYARQAREQLTSRAVAGDHLESARKLLFKLFAQQKDPVIKLRALWTLYGIGATDGKFLRAQLKDGNEHLRVWAIRLLTDDWRLDTVVGPVPGLPKPADVDALLPEFVHMAKDDPSGLVRLTLSSTLQRLPVALRPALAAPLLAHAEDANDHNLPLMLWYGLIPVGDSDPMALMKLAANCQIPITRTYIARRLGEDIEKNPAPLNDLLKVSLTKTEAFQSDILNGVSQALSGWRKAQKPASWDALQQKLANATDVKLRDRVRDLSVVFGDGRALDEVKRVVFDKDAEVNVRIAALKTLIDNRAPDLRSICEQLITTRYINATAVRGLAQFDDPAIGDKLAKSYRSFQLSERKAVMDTLVSRPAFVKPLLNEMAAGRIPRADLTVFHVRQIRGFNDDALTKRLTEVWGALRDSPDDKKQFMAKLRKQMTPAVIAQADKSQGRALFNQVCSACHTLYGHGGQVGPDLTGSGRTELEYLLDNVVDPSAVVGADFRMFIFDLKDGRVINGIISAKTERTITLKTMTEVMTIERSEIEKMQESTLSIMPEGLLEALSETQVRDLLAYLMNKTQVDLPTQTASGK